MLYVIIDAFGFLDEILKQKTDLLLLAKYYLNFLPLIFVQVSAFACLLGCLYTLGVLNRNNEIIAMRSAGQSIFQITRTVIIFSFLVSLLIFFVNDKIVPLSEAAKQDLKIRMAEESKRPKAEKEITNLSVLGLQNRLFFINRFIPAENKMLGITILEEDENVSVHKKITASKGIYKDAKWHFFECIISFFDETGRFSRQPEYFYEKVMDIEESPRDFLRQMQNPELMSVAQLRDYISKLSLSGAKSVINSLRVDLYQRFFMPLVSVVIVIVGIPFALIMRRKATGLASLGIAIMVGFLYYVVNAVALAFGKAGVFPPLLAASLSHIIFLILGLWLIYGLN